MKRISILSLWLSLMLFVTLGLQNCKKPTPDPIKPGGTTNPGSTTTTPGSSTTGTVSTAPTVSTATVPTTSGITATSANVSAVLNANGGAAITQHGFVYSKTAQTPTLSDSKTELGATSGPFPLTITSKLTNLEANTTYYVRAYATNEKGTGYGAVGQLKTTEVPVVANSEDAETIYVGADYKTYAFDGVTGKPKATYGITGGSVYGDPAIANGVIYTGYSTLMAYQASDGKRLWEELGMGGQITEPATIANGVLYVSTNTKVLAYDPAKPTKKWDFTLESSTSPVVLDGVVYVAGSTGLYALNVADGARKWAYSTPLYTGVAVSGGLAYVSGPRNTMHAVEIATGNKKWTYQMGATFDALSSSPTVSNGIVYAGGGDKKLFAMDAATGTLKWDFLTGGNVYSSPFIDKGVVYVFSSDGNLYAVDGSTGAKKWGTNVGTTGTRSSQMSPVVVNGVVYIVRDNKTLYALDANTGAVKWQTATTESLTSNPTIIAKNGKVYYSGRSGAQQ